MEENICGPKKKYRGDHLSISETKYSNALHKYIIEQCSPHPYRGGKHLRPQEITSKSSFEHATKQVIERITHIRNRFK